MKSYLDSLLTRRPVPNHSNGFFPLNPLPLALLRCRKRRKTSAGRRIVLQRPPLSRR